MINRDMYLNKLINKKNNGLIKIITGVRRCGKSYLLFEIFHQYLKENGVNEDTIIEIALDELANVKYRNPVYLDQYIREKVVNTETRYYVFIDEIQLVESIANPYLEDKSSKIGFVDVLLGLMKIKNIDLYVTGSNSKMLSSDILTEFRGRGDELKVYPLSYKEYYDSCNDPNHAWREYSTYGGMPYLVSLSTHEDKSQYLKDLFSKTYITDILERNRILNDKDILEELISIISSSVGSLTNPKKLSNTFKSVKQIGISNVTITKYLDYLVDAFLISKAYRYDVKGKKYINTPLKYYFTDIGLRNAKLNFRQQEENHIMENIIYNELIVRGFDIDVGVVEFFNKNSEGKRNRVQLEIDFVANKGSQRFYIQSALNISEEEKREQEIKSLLRVSDSFKKIVIVKDDIIPWHDDNGILYLGIEQFLLEENSIML